MRQLVSDLLADVGLDLIGIVEPTYPDDAQRFRSWLQHGVPEGLSYLHRYIDKRTNPAALVEPSARSCVVFSTKYSVDKSLYPTYQNPKVAEYAYFKDYHKVMKKSAETFAARLSQELGEPLQYKVAIDSSPVLERALASKASSGFIGKNSMFIDPKQGSYILLGEVFFARAFDLDKQEKIDHAKRTAAGGCGSCKRCQVYCPTGALNSAYKLDVNKCLAYWSIENRGTVPFEFWPHFKKYLFGCDECQSVCPYNRGKPHSTKMPDLPILDLYDIATMGQSEYEAWFGGLPLTRAKIYGLKRNALIAMTVGCHDKLRCAQVQLLYSRWEILQQTAKMSLIYDYKKCGGGDLNPHGLRH